MEQLDENTIKLGQLVMVKNTSKKNLQNDVYVSLQIQDFDGNNQRCILFTQNEVSAMQKIYASWLLEKLELGKLYPIVIGKHKTNLLKISNLYCEEKILRISATQLKKAQYRAQQNPEDLTEKSFLRNLFD